VYIAFNYFAGSGFTLLNLLTGSHEFDSGELMIVLVGSFLLFLAGGWMFWNGIRNKLPLPHDKQGAQT